MGWQIMAEAIGLAVLGAIAHIVRAKVADHSDIADNFILAVVVGVACFAMLGEPSSVTAIPYMAAGYGASEAMDWLFKPWWNEE